MIDPHWSVIDLDPRTWRAIGGFFDPGQYIRAAQPGEHGLFVLHDGGRVMRVVDTVRGLRRDLALSRVDDPHELAGLLYSQGEWEKVHIIDKRHLASVANQAQENPRRDLTLDQYYHLVYSLVWDGSDGYVCVPARSGAWQGWTYQMQAFVASCPIRRLLRSWWRTQGKLPSAWSRPARSAYTHRHNAGNVRPSRPPNSTSRH